MHPQSRLAQRGVPSSGDPGACSWRTDAETLGNGVASSCGACPVAVPARVPMRSTSELEWWWWDACAFGRQVNHAALGCCAGLGPAFACIGIWVHGRWPAGWVGRCLARVGVWPMLMRWELGGCQGVVLPDPGSAVSIGWVCSARSWSILGSWCVRGAGSWRAWCWGCVLMGVLGLRALWGSGRRGRMGAVCASAMRRRVRVGLGA